MRERMRSPAVLAGVALWVASLTLYILTLAPTLTWGGDNIGVDGGEFLAAAKTLGVPHPPGYPTYTLLLRGFVEAAPVGDVAYRGNLMSAVLGAFSVALLYAVILRFARVLDKERPPYFSILGAAVGATIFAASPLFWSQSIITEVYTLNTLFAGLLLLLAADLALSEGEPRNANLKVALFGFLTGIGLGNHLTLLAVAAPLTLCLLRSIGWRNLVTPWSAGALILGLAIYLYIPIRAAQNPPVNWGNASTFEGFAWLVTGRAYQDYLFSVPLSTFPDRLINWIELVFKQFNPLGIFLGLVGARVLFAGGRGFLLASLLTLSLLSVYSLGYNTIDFQVLMLPAFMVFSIWTGIGFIRVLETLTDWVNSRSYSLNAFRFAAAKPVLLVSIGAFAALPITSIALNYQSTDLSEDNQAFAYARSVIDSIPNGAVVLSTEETSAFSLWYMSYVEEAERDIAAIAVPLLQFDWYWESISELYPDRVPSERPTDFGESIRSIVAHNAQDGKVFFTYREHLIADTYDLKVVGRLFEVSPRAN